MIASDGVWELMDSQDVADFVLSLGIDGPGSAPQVIADALMEHVMSLWAETTATTSPSSCSRCRGSPRRRRSDVPAATRARERAESKQRERRPRRSSAAGQREVASDLKSDPGGDAPAPAYMLSRKTLQAAEGRMEYAWRAW